MWSCCYHLHSNSIVKIVLFSVMSIYGCVGVCVCVCAFFVEIT